MTTEQLLIGDHYLFATEVINGLNKFYGIPVRVNQRHDDVYFFNNDISWGIITISYLFRKDFHRIFDQIKNKLKNKKEFENYCMLITVSKNDRYFFNFLRRVALIYEIAVCCYRNGRDYFSRAKRCIMWYQDKIYFRSAGSWPSLNKTASFLRTLGNPLLRVILEESSLQYPLTFSATVDKIEQRLIQSKNFDTLNGKELDFFRQQQKKFLTNERDEKEGAAFQTEKERAFLQCMESISHMVNNDTSDEICNIKERRAIIEYLGSLILSEISNKFHNKSLSSPENTSTNVTDLYEPFEKLFQSKQESDGQETEKESSTIEKESSTIEKESSTIEKESSTIEKEISTIEKEISAIEKEISTLEKEISTLEKESSTIENESSIIEKESSIIEKESSIIEKESSIIEKESSSVEKKNEATSSVFKGFSPHKSLSNTSKNEETETSNSELIAGDFSSSSAVKDKFSQLYSIDDLINDDTFLTKYINLSRKLNKSESTLWSSNNNFLYDRTNSLEAPQNEIFPEDSSEGKNLQQCRNENDHLDSWKDLQNSCSLSSDSKSQLPSSSVDTPEIVFAKQSAVSDDKRDIDTSIDNKGEYMFRVGNYVGTVEGNSPTLHIQYLPVDFGFTPVQTNTSAQANIPAEINTSNSEIDSNTLVDRSPSNSQPQRNRGKRKRRGKRGRRRK